MDIDRPKSEDVAKDEDADKKDKYGKNKKTLKVKYFRLSQFGHVMPMISLRMNTESSTSR